MMDKLKRKRGRLLHRGEGLTGIREKREEKID